MDQDCPHVIGDVACPVCEEAGLTRDRTLYLARKLAGFAGCGPDPDKGWVWEASEALKALAIEHWKI